MDELDLDDINASPVREIEWLGKRAYIRDLTLEQQIELTQKFEGRENQEPIADELRLMAACALCRADGTPMFDDTAVGVEALRNRSGAELLDLFQQISGGITDDDVQDAAKN